MTWSDDAVLLLLAAAAGRARADLDEPGRCPVVHDRDGPHARSECACEYLTWLLSMPPTSPLTIARRMLDHAAQERTDGA